MLNFRYLGNAKTDHGLYEVLLDDRVIGKIDVGTLPEAQPARHQAILERGRLFARFREIGLCQ